MYTLRVVESLAGRWWDVMGALDQNRCESATEPTRVDQNDEPFVARAPPSARRGSGDLSVIGSPATLDPGLEVCSIYGLTSGL